MGETLSWQDFSYEETVHSVPLSVMDKRQYLKWLYIPGQVLITAKSSFWGFQKDDQVFNKYKKKP